MREDTCEAELEMKSHLHQESCARKGREIEELKNNAAIMKKVLQK